MVCGVILSVCPFFWGFIDGVVEGDVVDMYV